MRILPLAAALALAMPAFAQEATTLQNVTLRGIVMKVFGAEVPITYTPDGKFTARPPGDEVSGFWKINGDKLCTTTTTDPKESCTVYPPGKKSGDTFDVTSAAFGVVSVTIK